MPRGNAMQITRRHMLGAGAAVTAALAPKQAAARWEQAERYPDPSVQILDPSFARYRQNNASIERIASGMRYGEGPVYFGDARCVLWSDLPNDRIMRWDEESGRTSVWRKPSNYANGLTRDRQGRLVACEHGARRVTRTEYDGSITVLIDSFDGKRLNSPNDIVVKSDHSIWFTDPLFGIRSTYVGNLGTQELPTNVYRIDRSGRAAVVAADINGPNGLAFSPDESKLYILESGVTPSLIRVYDVIEGGTKLANGRAFITTVAEENPDGFRVDIDGNLWCGWGRGEGLDGVMIFNPAGKRIGRILLPVRCANLCFGGLKRNRLFMAAGASLFSLFVNTQGAPGG
jgi:gluconolactonase